MVVYLVKNLPANAGDCGLDTWVGKIPQEKKMSTHSCILVWEIPRMQEPGRLQSTGSQKTGRVLATNNNNSACASISSFQIVASARKIGVI